MKIRSAIFLLFDDKARKNALIERAQAMNLEHAIVETVNRWQETNWRVTVYVKTPDQQSELLSLTTRLEVL